MASSTLPWQRLWSTLWGLIPSPTTDGRLLIGLLTRVKGRWACLFLGFRFYLLRQRPGGAVSKQTGASGGTADRCCRSLCFDADVGGYRQLVGESGVMEACAPGFRRTVSPVIPVAQQSGALCTPRSPVRRRKYGQRLGTVIECEQGVRRQAAGYRVNLYGKEREVLAALQTVKLKTLKCRSRCVGVSENAVGRLVYYQSRIVGDTDHRVLWRSLENRILL